MSAADERAILEAACQAPTAGNQQLYSIIVVRDQAERIRERRHVEVNERRDATEEDVNKQIRRLIKQTGETLEMSIKAGNNEERTETLRAQVAILEEYLPKQNQAFDSTLLM